MNFLLNTNQNTIKNNKNTVMQQTQTTNEPTPQNISKWSLGRKEIRAKNEFLMNQLDSKNLKISELRKENNELKIKLKLNGLYCTLIFLTKEFENFYSIIKFSLSSFSSSSMY